MKAFSFIHTADLHLDSPFKGISEVSEEISLELTGATFKAFNKIIDLCIEKQVDFLLITGDIYDGADRSLRAQLRFQDSYCPQCFQSKRIVVLLLHPPLCLRGCHLKHLFER